MKVKELIDTLNEFCDLETEIEFADGSELANISYQADLKRLSLGSFGDFIEPDNLAEGWVYLYNNPE